MEFATEYHLVQTYLKLVDQSKWTPYPETGDFDLLLVRKRDGFQVGIEAKQSLNAKVICQAAEVICGPAHIDRAGPDCRAVLVPRKKGHNEFGTLLRALGVVVIELHGRAGNPWASRSLPDSPYTEEQWPEHFPARRIALPDYVPDVRAGVAGPTKLTLWKIKAIKLVIILRRRGYVVRADFKRLEMHPSVWTQRGWLVPGPVRGQWVAGVGIPDFERQHPVNFGQIEADYDKWNGRDLEGVI